MLRLTALTAALPILAPVALHAQIAFTNATARMGGTTNSGGCMGVADMDGDGLDDICKLHNSRVFIVDYQNADGSFTPVNYGSVSNDVQWGMALADFSNGGHKDLVCGGNSDGVHYLRITAPGSGTLSGLNNGSIFMQCNNAADIDNDGHTDFFGCHDVGAPKIWMNDGSGALAFANVINFTTTPSSDMSGNYGSVWTDFDNDGDLDLYIAKCRQGVNNPNDPRRWNRLFVNDGNGNYTDRATEFGVQLRDQSWTADFGDIDNDGDLDLVVTNHDATIKLFENDGTGHFTEITAGSGLAITGFFLQGKFVDLDNDGYLDLLIAGGIERVFRNNGDRTFTVAPNTFPANKAMHGFATGDLDNDGFQDVFANYGSSYVTPDPNNPDRLWLNNGNGNHWLTVRLRGTVSNRDAIGARVTITGPWGTQVREVRSGESYGIVTSFAASFGLGPHTVVPTVTVRWPSGLVETFNNIAADRTINIVEGTCISPVAEVSTTGAPIVCGNGHTIVLTANAGFNHQWSTGETTRSISVDQPGHYRVTIDDGQGCSATTGIFVLLDPDETPTVTVTGETTFCEGGEVLLTSSPAASYSWTGGGTGQSTQVSASGSYTVTVQGTCRSFTSTPVQVTVLDAPDAPVADDVTIPAPGPATLLAIGDSIRWYDVPTGGTAIGSGNVFGTPPVTTTTSFWCSASTEHPGESAHGGPAARTGTGQFHPNSDNYQIFTANEPFTLRSVKVHANGAGNRTIAIIDQGTGATVVSRAFSIPSGESRVRLDFEVPAAGSYGLRTVGGNPQLWRDQFSGSSPHGYPYPLGTLGEIVSSSVSGNNATGYYYFFYDWEVEAPGTVCEGPRTEVVVRIGTVGLPEANAANGMRVWPNPVDGMLTIALAGARDRVDIALLDITGRTVMMRQVDMHAQRDGLVQLDLKGLAGGEYVVRATHDQGVGTQRVMVR